MLNFNPNFYNMPRFEDDLLRHIATQVSDDEGEQGCWIKARKHSHCYDHEYPHHPDTKGRRWNREVTRHYSAGDIVIYKVGASDHNYFVHPTDQCRALFEGTHPGWRLK